MALETAEKPATDKTRHPSDAAQPSARPGGLVQLHEMEGSQAFAKSKPDITNSDGSLNVTPINFSNIAQLRGGAGAGADATALPGSQRPDGSIVTAKLDAEVLPGAHRADGSVVANTPDAAVPPGKPRADGTIQPGQPEAAVLPGAAPEATLSRPRVSPEAPVATDRPLLSERQVEALAKPPETMTNPDANLQTEIAASKTKLEGLAPKGVEGAQFRHQMDLIEHRNPPLDATSINKIYDQASLLMDDKNNPTDKMSRDNRILLAGSMLKDIAHPRSTDQGAHSTCNVTTLEKVLNSTDPVKFANMVSEIGMTGAFHSPTDNRLITLDPNSLKPDKEASLALGQNTDGKRNFATQLFDVGAVNDYWQRQNPPLRYSQETPDNPADTGERLRFPDGREVPGPDGKPMRMPGLTQDAIGKVGRDLGLKGDFIIDSNEMAGYSASTANKKVGSQEEFEKALAADPSSPKVILVHAGDKIFNGKASEGAHVVTASDYQKGPPAMVYLSNQWGEEQNKWVKVSDLYAATGGTPTNDGTTDGGRTDGGRTDGGRTDGGRTDGGRTDGGRTDGGRRDGGDNRAPDNTDAPDGGQHKGWSRQDGVMREDDFRAWHKQIQEDYLEHLDQKKEKEPVPVIDPNHPKVNDHAGLIAPLQQQLAQALENHDTLLAGYLRQSIGAIQADS